MITSEFLTLQFLVKLLLGFLIFITFYVTIQVYFLRFAFHREESEGIGVFKTLPHIQDEVPCENS